MADRKFRLVTRSDFDGLVCAVLFKELNLIDDILFVHPKDMQDGVVDVCEWDITTNLPYVPGVHLAFDHHFSETLRNDVVHPNHVIDPDAPSAARVVYDFYGGRERFPHIGEDMIQAVDQADSARYDLEEVLEPSGWALLNFLMDPRTGLGRFRTFRISNYQLMMELIDYCRDHTVDQILKLPDVAERVELYFDQQHLFKQQIERIAKVDGDVVLLDLREENIIHAGNRFMIYAMFPEATVSVHRIWGRAKLNTVFAVGKSIFDKSNPVNIGELMLHYGGGGHQNAGTCQVCHETADEVERELLRSLQKSAAESAAA